MQRFAKNKANSENFLLKSNFLNLCKPYFQVFSYHKTIILILFAGEYLKVGFTKFILLSKKGKSYPPILPIVSLTLVNC